MHILITGGAGFLGNRLAQALLARGHLRNQPIQSIVLTDIVKPAQSELLNSPLVRCECGDLLEMMGALLTTRFDAVFHFAAAVSGECESDFDLGLRSNLDATSALLAGLRSQAATSGIPPTFFFASSLAVFGADPAIALADVIGDDTLPTPQTSYGIQKFMCEQLVADYTRKGFIDGRAARLMNVSVRPGRPNGAASSFLSGIVREPLAGLPSRCPVPLSTQVALASPDTTIAGILAVVEASRDDFGGRTAINLPALTVTVAEMIQALRDAAGESVVARITIEPDARIGQIVGGWPSKFSSKRSDRLGLPVDSSCSAIVEQYMREVALQLPA